MPTMANIVVNNASAVATTYTAITSSSGDRVPALWLNNASSTIRAHRQKLMSEFHDNGNGTTRVGVVQYEYPVIATVNGVETIVAKIPLKLVGSLPKSVPDSVVLDAITLGLGLMGSALIKSAFAEQTAPR